MSELKEITIYDLARQLNISVATVSRALNDDPVVSSKTKKKISALATEMGYRHNRFASSLRKQRTNTIGVMVHELNSNFMVSVLSGIEKVAAANGYDVLITNSSESYEAERANALNLFHKRVDGLIASLASDSAGLDHFSMYADKGLPVVFFDRVEESSNAIKVIIDNYKCGYQATKHLIDQGCRRIAILTSSLKRNVYEQRFKGYADALRDAHLPRNDQWVLVKDLSENSGTEAAHELLAMDPMPDGLFVTNDFVAAVCMHTLKENGVKVPQDIAVVGFNNDAISRIVEPKLSTVDYPGRDLGEIAARNLINHLKGLSDLSHTSTIIVRSELVIRESSLRNKL